MTESRAVSEDVIQHSLKSLRQALAENSKLHRVSSAIINLMRTKYGGNWLVNIRNKDDQMGLRFHGRREGLFLTFSTAGGTYRVQLN